MRMLEIVRGAVTNPATPWVLFENGTVVFLPEVEGDLAERAVAVLKEWGAVQSGSPAGDFGVTSLSSGGYAVTCHHNDIMTFLGPEQEGPEVAIGLHGRSLRDQDARELKVIHVEPPRGNRLSSWMEVKPEELWAKLDSGDYEAGHVVALALGHDDFVDQARRRILTEPNGELVYPLAEALWNLGSCRDWLLGEFKFDRLYRLAAAALIDVTSTWRALHQQDPDTCPPPAEGDLLGELWPQTRPGDLPEEAARALIKVDSSPTTRWLLGEGTTVFLDDDGTAYRESELPVTLAGTFLLLYRQSLSLENGVVARPSPRGLQISSRGVVYSVSRKPLEESGAEMLVTGIDHNGKMKGATAQAIMAAAGFEIENEAKHELAQTERTQGTVVVTGPHALFRAGARCVAHVVSTPKYTPKSPGWLRRGTSGVLEAARRYQIKRVATTALGTSGGIEAPVAARLMIEVAKNWDSTPVHLTFCLPSPRVYEAFVAELRQHKLFYVEDE